MKWIKYDGKPSDVDNILILYNDGRINSWWYGTGYEPHRNATHWIPMDQVPLPPITSNVASSKVTFGENIKDAAKEYIRSILPGLMNEQQQPKKEPEKMVRGVYISWWKFHYRDLDEFYVKKDKDSDLMRFEMEHGEEYTIPEWLAHHLIKNSHQINHSYDKEKKVITSKKSYIRGFMILETL